jgi:nitrate reductase NapAB chaperone NapD
MLISGLVITLSQQAQAAEQAVEAIAGHSRISLDGPATGSRLAAVLDTPDRQTDLTVWEWLWDLPGVVHVDVVFIHFEDIEANIAGQSLSSTSLGG